MKIFRGILKNIEKLVGKIERAETFLGLLDFGNYKKKIIKTLLLFSRFCSHCLSIRNFANWNN